MTSDQQNEAQRHHPQAADRSRKRSFLIGISLLVTLGLVLSVLSYLYPRTSRLSPDEIVSRAAANRAKVKSYHIVYVTKEIRNGKTDPTRIEEEWSSGTWKCKYISRSAKGDWEVEGICRDDRLIFYSPAQRIALFAPLHSYKSTEADRKAARSRSQSHLRGWKTVRAERIDGRICDVIAGPLNGTLTTRAIDRRTGFVLRKSAKAKRFSISTEATRFESDPRFADSIFSISIPKSVFTIRGAVDSSLFADAKPGPMKDPSKTARLVWKALYLNTDCPIRLHMAAVPAYIPRDFRLLGVVPDPERWRRSEEGDRRPLQIAYVNQHTGASLVISEGNANKRPFEGSPVSLGKQQGWLAYYSKPYRYGVLAFANNGTCYSLVGTDLPKNEMIRVAKSIRPIGSRNPGAWQITARVDGSPESAARAAKIIQKRLQTLDLAGGAVRQVGTSLLITANGGRLDLLRQVVTTPGHISCVPIPKGFCVGFVESPNPHSILQTHDARPVSGATLMNASSPVVTEKNLAPDLLIPPDQDCLFLRVTPEGQKRLHELAQRSPSGEYAILLDQTFVGHDGNSSENGDHDSILISFQPVGIIHLTRAVAYSGPLPARVSILSSRQVR